MKYILIVSVLFVVITSCTRQKETIERDSLSREDFREHINLNNPCEIVIDSLLNPANFIVMNDSVLVVGNQDNCEYLLEVYSLNTKEALARLVSKGNGPGEMTACAVNNHTNTSSDFYLQDIATQLYYTVNLDSILKNNRLQILSKFKYSSEILGTADLCLLDSIHYIGYNMWYIDDDKFSNNVTSSLDIYKKDVDSNKGLNEFEYFVGSVNGAYFFKNPLTNRIWLADMHSDVIRIYDDSLKLIHSLEGPDNLNPQYTQVQSNAPIKFISFANEYDYRAYSDYFVTDKYIYLVYEGNKHFDPKNLKPVEIFKFDFDGNPICNYKLDRYVYSISIDHSEKYLYCASRKSVMEPPILLRYEL